jgi:hypothetical protein
MFANIRRRHYNKYMPAKKNVRIIAILSIACVAVVAALVISHVTILKKEASVSWREDFASVYKAEEDVLPVGWQLRKKPLTKPAVFSVKKYSGTDDAFLHMEADKASASLITKVDGVDLKKTPLLRWRWRAATLPEGADGRVKAKDDQAIGIYVGAGSALSNKSVSYRWDTETPRGAEGNCAYNLGRIKIIWYTLRSKNDARDDRWFIEERNVAEDFKKAWGFYPEIIYLSVSCNSQYTSSSAVADLDWIEFFSRTSQ